MFNAIFGNFLFSSKGSSVSEENSKCSATEASTQTTSISEATQTASFDVQIGVGSNDDNTKMTDMTTSTFRNTTNQLDWVIIDPSEGNNDHLMEESHIEHKSQHMNNLVEMGCENEPANWKSNTDDSDVLLGSFFDKNEHEESSIMSKLFRSGLGLSEQLNQMEQSNEIEAGQIKKPTEDPTWLITPLPCLTSITESSHQRSMIDNYPLENLLIEHPSMSVFISATNSQHQSINSLPVATSSTSASPSTQQKHLSQSVSLPLINVSNQIEVTQLEKICCEMKTPETKEEKQEIKKKNKKANKKNNRKPNRKVPRRSVKFDKKSIVADCDLEPIIFVIGDDEITCDEQPSLAEQHVAVQVEESLVAAEVNVNVVEVLEQAVEQQIESANSSIQLIRKSKKSKKSKASPTTQVATKSANKSSNNKENMQVKTLLLNEAKKCVSPITHYNSNRFELNLLNKNQMKRNNKNSTFSSLRNNVNSNQRKYHKLQQPSFSINIQQF